MNLTMLIKLICTIGLASTVLAAGNEKIRNTNVTGTAGLTGEKSPFKANTSRLSLGYIGRGYDIYLGNPVSDVGEVDQGFRLPVIDLPFTSRFTSDGQHRVPDNVDVISETSASFGSSFHHVKTETDYQSMLMVDVSVNANAAGWGFTGSFSASTSYQRTVNELRKGQSSTLDVIGRANVYKSRLAPTGSKLSEMFENAIQNLPSENCEDDAMQQKYIQLIQRFGTHYTTEVVMGAKAVQELRFWNSDLDRFQSEGIDVKVAAQLSYSGISIEAGGGFSIGLSNNEQLKQMVANTQKSRREYYIGGSPPPGEYLEGSTESLREWAKSAAKNPAPIQYKLSSIDNLIRAEYFKRTTAGIYEKRKCVRKALFSYCTSTIAFNHCGLKTETNSNGTFNTLKFGDFVKVTNGNKYLALSQKYGVSPGLTIKPLTTVSTITNYDGLFQLVPPEGIDVKLGSNIHYGEPFLLKTIEGDMMYTGNAFTENTEMTSPAKLMDIFMNTDEEMPVNISKSEVTDFSIFLRKENVCSYLVSLQSFCFTGDYDTFEVQITGNRGTVSGMVTVQCNCGGYAGFTKCGNPWFHSFLHDYDIGKIHTVQIMGIGEDTNRITGLKVKTLINGEKRDISWLGTTDRRGRQMTLRKDRNHFSASENSIPLKMFPIQFTFHSKDKSKLQGQSVTDRDTGYIQILSSIPKKTYWDQPITHVMSLSNMRKIRIKELGLEGHEPISKDCRGFIYPSTTQLSHRHNLSDQILISFDVTVMVNHVEIEANQSFNFTLAYINPENEQFLEISDLNKTLKNTTLNLKLRKPIYTTAIKVSSVEEVNNITDVVTMLAIVGCPSAIIDVGTIDKRSQEWKLERSENKLQTAPYFNIVPGSNQDFDVGELFKKSEVEVQWTFSTVVPLDTSQIACNFNTEYFQNVLYSTSNTVELKIDNIRLNKRVIDSNTVLLITIDMTAINQLEYELGSTALNSTIRKIVKDVSCTNEINLSSTENQSTLYTGIVIGLSCFGLLTLVVLSLLIFKVYKRKTYLKENSRIRTHPVVNSLYNAEGEGEINQPKLYENEGEIKDTSIPIINIVHHVNDERNSQF